jgi:iron complex outermembrane receptor protein
MGNHQLRAGLAISLGLAGTPCAAQSETSGLSEAPAQTTQDLAKLANMPLEELVNTRVTSVSGRPGSRFTAPAAITVITNEDIRRNGHRSVVSALRMVPGFYVSRVNASSWVAGARGLAGSSLTANRYLVLMDGRSVYDPLTSTTWWDTLDIPLADVDRIEVIRGPGASLWGVNAMHGVINIITKRAIDTQGTLAQASLGTDDTHQATFRYGEATSDTTSYRVYAKYGHVGDFENAQGESIGDQWASWRAGFRVDGSLTQKTTYTLQGDAYTHPQAHETVQQLPVPGRDRVFTTSSTDGTVDGGYVLFRALNGFEGERGWMLRTYADRSRRYNARFGVQRNTFDVEYRNWMPWGGIHQLIWGGQYDVTQDRIDNGPVLQFDDPRRTWSTINAFVQNTTELSPDRAFLMLGTKLTRHSFVDEVLPQPTIRFWWTPSERQTFWAAASRPVRVPSRFEEDGRLVFAYLDVGAVFTGTPNGTIVPLALSGDDTLEPERMLALEAGHRWQINDRWAIDTALFHHRHDRLIEPPPAVFGRFTDEASGRTWGGDIAISAMVTDRWRLEGSYSRLRVRIDGPAFPFEETSSPSELAQLHSYFDVRDDVEFNAAVYHVGRIPFSGTPAYTRADLGMTWRPRPGLEIAFWGQNLTDPAHSEGSGAQVPRTAYVQVSWALDR